MNRRRLLFSRSSAMQQAVALSLAICLTLPNSALALRQTGLEEQTDDQGKPIGPKAELVAALGGLSDNYSVPLVGFSTASTSAAGAEEALKPADRIFSTTPLSSLPQEQRQRLGDLAPMQKPTTGYKRLVSDAAIEQVAQRMNGLGLGFLLGKNFGYTRVQLDTDRHVYYLARALQRAVKEKRGKGLYVELLIPDFKEAQISKIIDVLLVIVYPQMLFDLTKKIPSWKSAYESLHPAMGQLLAEQARVQRSLPPRDESVLQKLMEAGILHEIGEAIWTVLEAKALVENNPTAVQLYGRWTTAFQSKLSVQKGRTWDVFTFKNILKAILSSQQGAQLGELRTEIFSDTFVAAVGDPYSIYQNFSGDPSKEDTAFISEVVKFFIAEHARGGYGFLIQTSTSGLEEIDGWLKELGIWSKSIGSGQLGQLKDRGTVIAEVRGVPSIVRLITITQGRPLSAEILRGRQVMAQLDLLPEQTMKSLTQQFGAVEPLPRSITPEAVASLVSRLKDLDAQGPPKAMLLVDPETAEQIKTALAEVDPEWKVPALIVGVPKDLLDTTNPDTILAYLLNLLAQVDQIPGRHIERLEATLTSEAKHQTLFLSSGA